MRRPDAVCNRMAEPRPRREACVAAEDVRAFLRANPGWLAADPELYASMEPPRRVHGDRMADHMAALLARARHDTASGTADRRATEGFVARVQETVLALLRMDAVQCLADFPALLRLDGARLCVEGAQPYAARIPPGTVNARLGRRETLIGPAQRDIVVHGEAAALAQHEALVRVGLRGAPALLALACRDGSGLSGVTASSLAFLAQALAARLEPLG